MNASLSESFFQWAPNDSTDLISMANLSIIHSVKSWQQLDLEANDITRIATRDAPTSLGSTCSPHAVVYNSPSGHPGLLWMMKITH